MSSSNGCLRLDFRRLPSYSVYVIRKEVFFGKFFCCYKLKIFKNEFLLGFQGPEATGEISLLTQFISANLEMCINQLKNIRRKIPPGEASLNVSHALLQKLSTCCQNLNRLMKTIHEVVKNSRQYILLQGGNFFQLLISIFFFLIYN